MTSRLSKRLGLSGIALALLGRGAAESATLVEWHRTIVFPRVAAVLQGISSQSAGTSGEIVAALSILLALWALVARRSRALGALCLVAGATVFSFYATWGLAYRYAPLAGRMAPLAPAPDADELTAIADASARLLARASIADVSFAGSDSDFLRRINAGLTSGFGRWPESLEAAKVRGIAFGPAKLSRVSLAMSRLQLSGYYFPWTGEAQLNAEMPRTLWARVAAHEKAHQRGFAREDEATAIGVITCLSSSDPTVFYGGALGLFVGLDRELARMNPDARRRIWDGLPRSVVENLQAEVAFWKRYDGVAGAVSERVNDTYLKSQGVRSGIASYGEGTRLILQALRTPAIGVGSLLDDTPRVRPQ